MSRPRFLRAMRAFADDLRAALRLPIADPGFAAAVAVVLALGVGLNAAVFSVVDGLLLRPLPVTAPEELIAVFSEAPGELMSHGPVSLSDYEALREGVGTLRELFATTYSPVAVETVDQSRIALVERATPNYFSLLGVRPQLGRAFAPDDDASVVVLSHTAWRRRYGSDPAVVGESLRINGRPVVVIGVAPKGFTGLTQGIAPELWQPLLLAAPGEEDFARWLWVTGRLAEGRSAAEARAEVEALAQRRRQDLSRTRNQYGFVAVSKERTRVLPGFDEKLVAASTLAMMGVALVLLSACVNIAGLLLSRAVGRRREIAVRLALGASPGRIVQRLLTESLVLAVPGGILGWLGAAFTVAVLDGLRLPVPVDLVFGSALDVRVLAFASMISFAAMFVFGLTPALAASRPDLRAVLGDGASTASQSRGGRRKREALVAAQIALSLVLLLGAAFAFHGLQRALRIDPGFNAEGAVTASFAPRLASDSVTETDLKRFYERLLARVRALPEVESAGLTSHLPLSVEAMFEKIRPRAAGSGTEEDWLRIDAATVGPGYFAAMQTEILHGRGFQDTDTESSPLVAVVNETLAQRLPGSGMPGEEIFVEGIEKPYRIVGIVRDGKYRTPGEAPRPFLFLTFAQERWGRGGRSGEISSGTETLLVRTKGSPIATLTALREIAREVDENVALSRLTTLEEALAPALAPVRLAVWFFGAFAFLSLILTVTGSYAITAHAVGRRERELGIRQALGARPDHLLWLILRDGLRTAALGLTLGALVAVALLKTLEPFLGEVEIFDPRIWSVSIFLLVAAVFSACYVPAQRAAQSDPQATLR